MGSGAPFQLPLSEATCRKTLCHCHHSDLRNDSFHTLCSSHTLLFCPFPGAAGKQQTTPTKGRWVLSPRGEGQSRNSKGISRVPGCSGCRLGTRTGSGRCRGKPFPHIQDKKNLKKLAEQSSCARQSKSKEIPEHTDGKFPLQLNTPLVNVYTQGI